VINYSLLAQAIEHYKKRGYQEISVPWIVDLPTLKITIPSEIIPSSTNDGYLVGSAEQGFLDLRIKEKINGKFVSTSPCFRENDTNDWLHQKYFMKTELFVNNEVSQEKLEQVIKDAVDFYSQFIKVQIIQIQESEYDIVDQKNKIELGSYGIRNHPLTGKWIFGTGLAEPRLSLVMRKQ
jgi:seryl-tRNA synthetase